MKVHPILFCSLLLGTVRAVELDVDSYDSIYDACKLLAVGLMDYYWGWDYGGTIGMFTHPYYWWEAGGAFGSIIDYSFYFENTTYTNTTITGIMYQTGDDNNFMPLNQTTTEGNDDQVFWGITAIQAAERNWTNPPAHDATWLELAEATFNTMKNRWDDGTCDGGLRWQIFQWNAGYDYKNTVANAGLFHLGARLLRYTGNDSYYLDWCEKTYNWLLGVGFVDEKLWRAYDGANSLDNCTDITPYLWSYNLALVVSGCAYMYNHTGEQIWYNRTLGYVKGASVFFDSHGVMYEAACEPVKTCQTDQRSFRAYLARFLGLTAALVPDTYDTIYEHLKISAIAAAQSCSGGYDHHTCGQNWSYPGWDGFYGLGEQMAALETIQNLLIKDRPAPYRLGDGASSTGNVLYGNSTYVATAKLLDLNKGDTAAASIITVFIGITILCLGYFVVV